jgi:hypothetical protein
VKVTLTDAFKGTKEIEVTINTVCLNFGQGVSDSSKLKQWVPPTGKQNNPPIPSIRYIDQIGKMKVTFNQAMLLPTYVRYPDFQDPRLMMQNCTNVTANPDWCYNSTMFRKPITRSMQSGELVPDNRPLPQ